MEKLDKDSALEWFKAHGQSDVVVRRTGTVLRIEGICRGVDTLDACNSELKETEIDVGYEGIFIGLSFHETSLSIHIHATRGTPARALLSLPHNIPYGELLLLTTEEEGARKNNGNKEAEYSPYDLLHP